MPHRYKPRLLAHLAHDDYTPATVETLAADLRVDDPELFRRAVSLLADEGVLVVSPSGHVRLPSIEDILDENDRVRGVFRKHPKGFGFVEPERPVREGAVFIPPDGTLDALSGDTVLIEVYKEERGGRRGGGSGGGRGAGPRYSGVIVEIVQRKRASFAGELARTGNDWVVYPDGRELRDPVIVRDAEAKNAKAGDKVVIELIEYPKGNMLGEGVIVKVLGEAGRPSVEIQAAIATYNLPGDFPEECADEARELTRRYDEEIRAFEQRGAAALTLREDRTKDFILTIDPPDAKDYDDAISIRPLDRPGGGWELGVHIADVAHFVTPGTRLDEEAKQRGNSVYLPRFVIPMLPELLSNGICSLQEGVPRFCKSAYMRYDRDGNLLSSGVASTLIRSAKRLTYLEAQALIDGNPEEARRHARTPPNYTDELLGALRDMHGLAKAIEQRRHRQGMITLELPEVVLIYDEHGHVIDAEREDDAYTHRLIEMFMVEANEVLARLFEGMDVPLLRRVHPEPPPREIDEVRQVARVAGFTIPKNPTREELQALLDATRGTPAARAIHMAVLRTLTKAEYSPQRIGHFALASEAYAHFTSPIRRYPDLTVHRALAAYLELTENGARPPRTEGERRALGRRLLESGMCPPEDELTAIGAHCTRTEQNAEAAEKDLRQFFVLQLLAKQIGEEFRGVITGVSPRGVFVQLDKFLADGMVKAEDLPGDVTRSDRPPIWRVDPKTGALVDQNSGRSFNFGDTVTVRVAAVDLARRQMELVIADAAARAAGKAKPLKPLSLGGGMAHGTGAGFGPLGGMTGAQRRSHKSKQRDKRKPDWRRGK